MDDSFRSSCCETSQASLMKDSEASKLLPLGYQPSDYDVICGRGKGHYNQPGNRKFRDIIMARLNEYQSLKSKLDKTMFLNKIIEDVRSQNRGTAHFVRQVSSDLWEKLGDEQAREKVGHAIREALAPRYKVKSQQAVSEYVENNVHSANLKRQKNSVSSFEKNKINQNFEPEVIVNKAPKLKRQCTEDRVRSMFNFVDDEVFEPTPLHQCSSSHLNLADPLTRSLCTSIVRGDVSSNYLDEPAMANVVSEVSATQSQNSKWAEYQLQKKKSKQVDILSDDDDNHDGARGDTFEPVPIGGLNYSVSLTLAGLLRQISQPTFMRGASGLLAPPEFVARKISQSSFRRGTSALLAPDYFALSQFSC